MNKESKPGLFYTLNDTPVQVLYSVSGPNSKFPAVMVKSYPDDERKSVVTHIDVSAIKGPSEAVFAYLETIKDIPIEIKLKKKKEKTS